MRSRPASWTGQARRRIGKVGLVQFTDQTPEQLTLARGPQIRPRRYRGGFVTCRSRPLPSASNMSSLYPNYTRTLYHRPSALPRRRATSHRLLGERRRRAARLDRPRRAAARGLRRERAPLLQTGRRQSPWRRICPRQHARRPRERGDDAHVVAHESRQPCQVAVLQRGSNTFRINSHTHADSCRFPSRQNPSSCHLSTRQLRRERPATAVSAPRKPFSSRSSPAILLGLSPDRLPAQIGRAHV